MPKRILAAASLVFVLSAPLPAFADCTDPAKPEGTIIYNKDHKVMQFCDGLEWIAMSPPGGGITGAPEGCPTIGDKCADGSVYAGGHPTITGGRLYVPDNNQSAAAAWSSESIDTGADSADAGTANQNWIVENTSEINYPAFDACASLGRNGRTDWYLPAANELAVLHTNLAAIDAAASEPFAAGSYWSSTEDTGGSPAANAMLNDFTAGTPAAAAKADTHNVRCVRLYNPTVDWSELVNVPAGLDDGDDTGVGSETDPTVNTLAKATLNCTTDQIAEHNGTNWVCVDNAALSIANPGDCNEGAEISYDQASGNLRCVPDVQNPVWQTAERVWTGNAGESLSGVTALATDNAGSVTYSKQAGDAWVSVNSSTGELTGTAPGTPGGYSITVRATDPSSNYADRTFDLATDLCALDLDPVSDLGTECLNGEIYIGDTPDGGGDLYATTAAHETSTRWSPTYTTDLPMANCQTGCTGADGVCSPGDVSSCWTGQQNTADLVATTGADEPYEAAEYCDGLTDVHGKSDWYLPAQDELNLFWNGGSPLAGVLTDGTYYWSASERDPNHARIQRFNDGYQGNSSKRDARQVRCVRRD